MTDLTMDQTELAGLLDCDRTTIRRYQLQGMPHEESPRGKAHIFDGPVCMYWYYGREFLKRRNLPSLPAPTIVVLSYLRALEDEPYDFWWPRALKFACRAGAPKSEAETHVNRALAVLGR